VQVLEQVIGAGEACVTREIGERRVELAAGASRELLGATPAEREERRAARRRRRMSQDRTLGRGRRRSHDSYYRNGSDSQTVW
jgi:hypothetical protein